MRIDADEIVRFAEFARLDLDPSSIEPLRAQFETILEHFARIAEAGLDPGEEPARPPEPPPQPRPDDELACLSRDEALSNAPDAASGHFRVPRVLTG